MIGKISGRIDHRGADHVLVDVRGVGYIIYVSERTMMGLPATGGFCALYTELLVREDLLQLIGFPTLFEKEWHRLLTSVQGVGARAALAILGALGADGAGQAIALGDVRAIQAAPGIGPKIAQRVVMELKTKAAQLMAQGAHLHHEAVVDEGEITVAEHAVAPAPAPQKAASQKQHQAAQQADALSALVNLGYAHAEAAQALARAMADHQGAEAAILIKQALRLLAPQTQDK